jgi:aminoglycoside 6'-N-acetyltransferase
MHITLRPATPDDLALLEYWDTKPHVIASDPNGDWNWSHELQRSPAWREQLIACLDDRPIGFVQIIDPALEETRFWGDIGQGLRAIDIWIGEEGDLSKGYGTRIMQLVIARCFSDPEVSGILLDPMESNTRAIRFYERMGFRFVEKRIFGGDAGPVYRLDRSV